MLAIAYSLWINAMMAELELLRGYRTLEYAGWISDVEAGSRRIFDEGVLDFHDQAVEDRSVFLFDEWELAEVYRKSPAVAGRLATKDLLSAAQANMPPDFRHVAGERELKRPKMSYTQGPAGKKRIIIAPIALMRKFKQERGSITGTIDAEAGVKLSWRDRVIGIKLAAVATEDYIENRKLRALGEYQPGEVYVGGGDLEYVEVEA